ncbi:MAG TPA: hypothetical protein VGF97_18140 [Rhizomicrobium sp.]|jgi:hypothetical protein
MSGSEPTKITRGEILPPEAREVGMPPGTPLGLGILGAAKFAAIRRVLEQAQRAARAKANFIDAEGEVANAITRREAAREQLNHLDTIRSFEANRIRLAHESLVEQGEIAKLERRLQKMALEDEIAGKEAVRRRAAGRDQASDAGVPADAFADFIADMKRMPEVVKAATAVKEQIIREAGGEDKLSEVGQQSVEMVDALMNAFLQKQAEGKIL